MDQGLHEGRVIAHAVDGHFYGDGFRIICGFFDEPLDAGIERFVRMVDEDVARANGGEDIGMVLAQGQEEQRASMADL